MLIRAIHSCAVKFPDIAPAAVSLLIDFVSDSSEASAADVVLFARWTPYLPFLYHMTDACLRTMATERRWNPTLPFAPQ